jgi:hypothetical protein
MPSVFESGGRGSSSSHSALWLLLTLLPCACVALQLLIWRRWFTLHGNYLKEVKVFSASPHRS